MAPIAMAALACLQPGIDPVFLTLLSAAHPVRPADHGWIVGATQAGMAVGSLFVWWAGPRMPRAATMLAAFGALIAAVSTVMVDPAMTLMAIRACYGLAMGVLYTQCMSDATAGRPNGAYGAVFLLQLILSSLSALLLPAIADATNAGMALAALCAVPIIALLLVPVCRPRVAIPTMVIGAQFQPEPRSQRERLPIPSSGWALAAGTFLFICSTMMVWSFTGALAVEAGIDEEVIGQAVAIGSIVGAMTAASVMRERTIMPLAMTGLLCGLTLLAPIAGARSGEPIMFIGAMVLLNIGSTAVIIRGSGMASAQSRDPLFRRFVACTHPLGMIMGPVIGSIVTAMAGTNGLLFGAITTISAGVLAFGFAAIPAWRAANRWSGPSSSDLAEVGAARPVGD